MSCARTLHVYTFLDTRVSHGDSIRDYLPRVWIWLGAQGDTTPSVYLSFSDTLSDVSHFGNPAVLEYSHASCDLS